VYDLKINILPVWRELSVSGLTVRQNGMDGTGYGNVVAKSVTFPDTSPPRLVPL